MTGFSEYDRFDGLGLAELVKGGQISAEELVDASIDAIERENSALNAVVTPMYELARASAKAPLPEGPFRGVPFLLKDLGALYKGVPTSNGNALLRRLPAPYDTELVRRFRNAGLIVVGKTNTPEFGITPYTESVALGPAHNPWDLARTPGGSSGGSAAAVAARMTPIASGGDGGGSIRIPASCCGVFGLKPSRGRMPTGPVMGEAWHGFAIEHVLTRSVRDSAAMLDATAGADAGAPYAEPSRPAGSFLVQVEREPERLRIAFTAKPFLGHAVHPDCVRFLDETAKLLVGLGHEIVEAAPAIDGERFALNFLWIVCGEARADIELTASTLGRSISSSDFEPSTYALGLLGKAMAASEYANAARELQTATRDIARFFSQYDVLLTPTLAAPPPPIGALQPTAAEIAVLKVVSRLHAGWLLHALNVIEPLAAKTFDFIPYTPVFNVTGQPAMSVPLWWNDAGLPIGMHFIARFGDEATLFQLAGQLERAQPWKERRPS
jgi:amidase